MQPCRKRSGSLGATACYGERMADGTPTGTGRRWFTRSPRSWFGWRLVRMRGAARGPSGESRLLQVFGERHPFLFFGVVDRDENNRSLVATRCRDWRGTRGRGGGPLERSRTNNARLPHAATPLAQCASCCAYSCACSCACVLLPYAMAASVVLPSMRTRFPVVPAPNSKLGKRGADFLVFSWLGISMVEHFSHSRPAARSAPEAPRMPSPPLTSPPEHGAARQLSGLATENVKSKMTAQL